MMIGDTLSHFNLCMIEGAKIRRGITYRPNGQHSVFLLNPATTGSEILEDGRVILYRGADPALTSKKALPADQPMYDKKGNLTLNGKFHRAAMAYQSGQAPAENIRVYQKRHEGIWEYLGLYSLTEAWQVTEQERRVFRFRLERVEPQTSHSQRETHANCSENANPRLIPSEVKTLVWQRDGGCCVQCSSRENLHFDHIIPFSLGGASSADNVQVLCAVCNQQKSNKIQ